MSTRPAQQARSGALVWAAGLCLEGPRSSGSLLSSSSSSSTLTHPHAHLAQAASNSSEGTATAEHAKRLRSLDDTDVTRVALSRRELEASCVEAELAGQAEAVGLDSAFQPSPQEGGAGEWIVGRDPLPATQDHATLSGDQEGQPGNTQGSHPLRTHRGCDGHLRAFSHTPRA